MILATHIAFALISIVFVFYTVLSPSKIKLRITYFLTLGTILSGLIMLFIHPVHLGQACASGIVYLGFMIVISMIARKRLAIINQSADPFTGFVPVFGGTRLSMSRNKQVVKT